jgi:hypothetical protein
MSKPNPRKSKKAPTKPSTPWLFPNVQEWENVQSKKRAAYPCDPAASLRVALDALSSLEAAAPKPNAIAAVLDIAEAACRAIRRLDEEHTEALQAETGKRHYLAELRSSLPRELVPLSYKPASISELKPYPLTAKRLAFKGDALTALAPVFVLRIMEGDPANPLGMESVLGRVPIADELRASLRESSDLGEWSEAFYAWVESNWPDSIKPPKNGKGGALVAIAETRKKRQQTEAASVSALVLQQARDVLKPLIPKHKIKE